MPLVPEIMMSMGVVLIHQHPQVCWDKATPCKNDQKCNNHIIQHFSRHQLLITATKPLDGGGWNLWKRLKVCEFHESQGIIWNHQERSDSEIRSQHMEVSWNRGYPPVIHFRLGFSLYKPSSRGYPHLWKPSYHKVPTGWKMVVAARTCSTESPLDARLFLPKEGLMIHTYWYILQAGNGQPEIWVRNLFPNILPTCKFEASWKRRHAAGQFANPYLCIYQHSVGEAVWICILPVDYDICFWRV